MSEASSTEITEQLRIDRIKRSFTPFSSVDLSLSRSDSFPILDKTSLKNATRLESCPGMVVLASPCSQPHSPHHHHPFAERDTRY